MANATEPDTARTPGRLQLAISVLLGVATLGSVISLIWALTWSPAPGEPRLPDPPPCEGAPAAAQTPPPTAGQPAPQAPVATNALATNSAQGPPSTQQSTSSTVALVAVRKAAFERVNDDIRRYLIERERYKRLSFTFIGTGIVFGILASLLIALEVAQRWPTWGKPIVILLPLVVTASNSILGAYNLQESWDLRADGVRELEDIQFRLSTQPCTVEKLEPLVLRLDGLEYMQSGQNGNFPSESDADDQGNGSKDPSNALSPPPHRPPRPPRRH